MQGKETMKSVVFGDDSSLTESASSQLPLSQQHLALELTDAKTKIKRLRQELWAYAHTHKIDLHMHRDREMSETNQE